MPEDQVDPVQNDLPPCWSLVIQDMQARDQLGRQRYGTPLQPFNGRNALRDLSEELLDAIVYSRQLRFELGQLFIDLNRLYDLIGQSRSAEPAQYLLALILEKYKFLGEK